MMMKYFFAAIVLFMISCSSSGSESGLISPAPTYTDKPFSDMSPTTTQNIDWLKSGTSTRYGFDRFLDGTGLKYVSVEENKSTTVQSVVKGATRSSYANWQVALENPGVAVSLAGTTVALPAEQTDVALTALSLAGSTSAKNQVQVQGVSSGTITPTTMPDANDLRVVVYGPKTKQWAYLRVADPDNSATTPTYNPSPAHVDEYFNRVYNQAVLNVVTDAQPLLESKYDKNSNGLLDIALVDPEHGQELSILTNDVNSYTSGKTYDATSVLVKDFNIVSNLSRDAAVGATDIYIFGNLSTFSSWYTQSGWFKLGNSPSSAPIVIITGCSANGTTAQYPGSSNSYTEYKCTLSTGLSAAVSKGTDQLMLYRIAGFEGFVSLPFNLSTESNSEQQTLQTIAHETGHHFSLSDVSDVDSKNVMHYSVNNVGGEYLTVRGEVPVTTGTPTPSGAPTEYQWNILNLSSNGAY